MASAVDIVQGDLYGLTDGSSASTICVGRILVPRGIREVYTVRGAVKLNPAEGTAELALLYQLYGAPHVTIEPVPKHLILSQPDALNPPLSSNDFRRHIPMGFCHTPRTARLALAVLVPTSRATSRHERP